MPCKNCVITIVRYTYKPCFTMRKFMCVLQHRKCNYKECATIPTDLHTTAVGNFQYKFARHIKGTTLHFQNQTHHTIRFFNKCDANTKIITNYGHCNVMQKTIKKIILNLHCRTPKPNALSLNVHLQRQTSKEPQNITTNCNQNTKIQSKHRIPKSQQSILHCPNIALIHQLSMFILKD